MKQEECCLVAEIPIFGSKIAPCEGEVKYRSHWKLYLCNEHYRATLVPELNDALSKKYKEIFPEENHRWLTKV